MNKNMKKLKKEAEEQGWTVEVTKKNHLKWISPDGDSVITSSTPSEYRGQKNFLSSLRRRGFKDR